MGRIMRKRGCWTRGLLLAASLLSLGACRDGNQTDDLKPGVLEIPGSGTCELIVGELGEAFQRQHPSVQVVVPPSIGSTGGMAAVGEGKAVIARVGRRPKGAELEYGLEYVEFARDALAFAVGLGVTGVTSLTLAQVSDIYAGRITRWSEVGGPDRPINLIHREKNESTRQELAKAIPGLGEGQEPAQAKLVYRDYEVLELLEKFPTAIGFTTRSNLMSGSGNWTILQLDGVQPDAASLSAGTYPFSLEMGFVRPAGIDNPLAQAFIDFVQSPAGVEIIRSRSLVVLQSGDQ